MTALPWGGTWPDLPTFRQLAGSRDDDRPRRVIPVVRRILADELTPVGLYRALAHGRPGTFIMESADAGGAWSRWSFIGVASRAQLIADGDGQARWLGDVPVGIPQTGPVLDVLRAALAALRTPPVDDPEFPPFTGGLAGSLGWGIVRQWEPTLPATAPDELHAPTLALALATDVVALDHHTGTLWLIANAINMDNSDQRVDWAYANAVERLDAMAEQIARAKPYAPAVVAADAPVPDLEFRSTQAEFEQAVQAGKVAIRDGEVFQVVLSQRIDLDSPADPLEVYRALRTINPSPYMYFFHLGVSTDASASQPLLNRPGGLTDVTEFPASAVPVWSVEQRRQGRLVRRNHQGPPPADFYVVGASPETLVKVDHGEVLTFPIAGSRPRGKTPAEDVALGEELLADPKELSEHVMLVDLARNDLSKVCRPGTVAVAEFMALRRFSHIMHICSTVVGSLEGDHDALDVLLATFPAGTLSGAPKPRAIALIDELEPAARGVYGGTVGYFDFAGNLDMAIAIRTAFIRGQRASVQAGAGIVADSDPETEYVEARNKAAAAVRAIQLAAQLRPLAASHHQHRRID